MDIKETSTNYEEMRRRRIVYCATRWMHLNIIYELRICVYDVRMGDTYHQTDMQMWTRFLSSYLHVPCSIIIVGYTTIVYSSLSLYIYMYLLNLYLFVVNLHRWFFDNWRQVDLTWGDVCWKRHRDGWYITDTSGFTTTTVHWHGRYCCNNGMRCKRRPDVRIISAFIIVSCRWNWAMAMSHFRWNPSGSIQ